MAPPLSHLRLLAPPFRLLLGAMWRVARQQAHEHYGMLEELVATATEAVPELLSIKEKTVLLLALRTKIFLSDPDPAHLDRTKVSTVADSEWTRSMSALKDAVSQGLDPRTLREVFGREFDTALESLLCHFLSRLQQLFPVPDFTQISSMLSDDWPERCLQEVKSEELKELLTNHSTEPISTCAAPEGKSEVVLKSAWKQLLLLQKMKEESAGSKTTNQEPGVSKPTNQKPDLSKTASQNLAVFKLINQKLALPVLTIQRPALVWPITQNTAVANQRPAVSTPTNQQPLGAKLTNQKQAVAKPTNQPPSAAKPTNQEPAIYEVEIVIGQEPLDDRDSNQSGPAVSAAFHQSELTVSAAVNQSQPSTASISDLSEPRAAAVDQSEPSSSSVTDQSEPVSSESTPQDSVSQNPQRLAHKCPHCGKCFYYRSQVLKHLESSRTCGSAPRPISSLRCFQCEAVFQTNADLVSHLRTHRTPYPVLGQTRSKTQEKKQKDSIKTKRRENHQGALKRREESTDNTQEQPSFSCCLCNETFKSQSHLLTHLDKHVLKGEEPRYDCLYCDQTFTGSTLLRIHQRSHQPRPFTCPVCSKCFGTEGALSGHRRLHGEKSFLCHTCGRGFVSRSSLKVHVRTHTGERPYTCAICGRGFPFNAGLKVHLRRHLGDKPYTCSVCGKSWYSGGELQSHMRSHTGEKPYGCIECGKRFTVSTHLTAHRRTHTGEKPYSCPECGKKFRRKFDQQRHLGTHFNQRPFTCPHCPRTYTCTNHLRRHLQTHQDQDRDQH